MENVQFLWKHLYTIPVVSVTLHCGLKEINTAQNIHSHPLGINWYLLETIEPNTYPIEFEVCGNFYFCPVKVGECFLLLVHSQVKGTILDAK